MVEQTEAGRFRPFASSRHSNCFRYLFLIRSSPGDLYRKYRLDHQFGYPGSELRSLEGLWSKSRTLMKRW
jgi:hypothetical protein